ncbi:hypothetical protein AB0B66_43650 [Catellatospora sp. NPDC049111]
MIQLHPHAGEPFTIKHNPASYPLNGIDAPFKPSRARHDVAVKVLG